jgi:hypothetical protein
VAAASAGRQRTIDLRLWRQHGRTETTLESLDRSPLFRRQAQGARRQSSALCQTPEHITASSRLRLSALLRTLPAIAALHLHDIRQFSRPHRGPGLSMRRRRSSLLLLCTKTDQSGDSSAVPLAASGRISALGQRRRSWGCTGASAPPPQADDQPLNQSFLGASSEHHVTDPLGHICGGARATRPPTL